jgi:hypothetical protein
MAITLSKSLINLMAEENDIFLKIAAGVFAAVEVVLLGLVHQRGVGEFSLPTLPMVIGDCFPVPLDCKMTALKFHRYQNI